MTRRDEILPATTDADAVSGAVLNFDSDSVLNTDDAEEVLQHAEEIAFNIADGSRLQDVAAFLDGIVDGVTPVNDVSKNRIMQDIKREFAKFKQEISSSKTAQLWLQFRKMVTILCKSIKAQRTGNWQLHLESVSEMLPFFAAAGYYLYAKSGYLYLQTMSELEVKNPVVYKKFNEEGFHVIRRSDRHWAGLSPDLVIEQALMRTMKTSGNLTRGTGMGEVQRNAWLLSSPACAAYDAAVQHLTGVSYMTSEQHKDESNARKVKDYIDGLKITC